MSAKARVVLVCLVVVLAGGGLLLFHQRSTLAVLYSGYGSVASGPLTLEVSVVPPVGKPGDRMTLTARMSNSGAGALTPVAVVRLPQGVAPDVFQLPAGASMNLQDGTLTWMPSVGPQQPVRELTMELTVHTVDVAQPEQPVEFALRDGVEERRSEALIWTGIPPISGLTPPGQTVAVGQPLKLASAITGPGPLSEVWDLGDGRRLNLSEPEVAFAMPGEYVVSVEVANPAGATRQQFSVSVVASPVAGFQPDDDNPGVGQAVAFRNQSGGQPPLRVSWDFGDGSSSNESDPNHAYQVAGTYQVRQTVENDFGRSEAFWTVQVGTAPVADMILMDRTTVGQPLQGEALGDASVTHFVWDMGDGRQKSGPNVAHLYRLPGDYYVRLVAANAFGSTEIGRWVRVEPGITTLYMPAAFFMTVAATVADSPLSADYPVDVVVDSPDVELNGALTLPVMSFPEGTTPAEQLFGYINEARAMFNLSPLAYAYELSLAAQGHAADKSRSPEDPHTGTDGSTPPERLLRNGYRGGYAGEATAWGFADARLAVEFWLNSAPHRALLLNRNTNEVGVGFAQDYDSRNIWHWAADFGVSYGAASAPAIRVQEPVSGIMVEDGDVVNFSWLWPLPLASDQYFAVYVLKSNLAVLVGTSNQPVSGSRYLVSADLNQRFAGLWADDETLANTQWFVRLEDGRGAQVAESAGRSIFVQRAAVMGVPPLATGLPNEELPPIVTETPAASPTPQPATPVPTVPPPAVEPPPVIITATPQP